MLDFINYIYKFKPDVIVNTHFLSTEIVAGLRRRKLLKVPQVTIVTDYDAHAYWANFPNEKFFVGQEGAVGNLTHVNPMINEEVRRRGFARGAKDKGKARGAKRRADKDTRSLEIRRATATGEARSNVVLSSSISRERALLARVDKDTRSLKDDVQGRLASLSRR